MIQPHMNLVVLKLTEECKTSTKTRFLNCVRHLQVNRHPEQLHPSPEVAFDSERSGFVVAFTFRFMSVKNGSRFRRENGDSSRLRESG